MNRFLVAALVFVGLAFASRGSAQAPRPLPSWLAAEIQLPGAGPERWVNVRVEIDGLPWTLVGCVSSARGVCFATHRIELDEAARRALVRRITEVQTMPRCEPEGFAPGDPVYAIRGPGFGDHEGHLPANVGPPTPRGSGACAAPSRLAVWLIERMGAGGATRPR